MIAALQGLFGFPLTSLLLRREAARLKDEYRAGRLEAPVVAEAGPAAEGRLPSFLRTTRGTLFCVGVTVLLSIGINNLTNGTLNTFVVAVLSGSPCSRWWWASCWATASPCRSRSGSRRSTASRAR